MTQEYKPGEIVPQSGIYMITHDPAHPGMPHEVTVIKGPRFPTCRHSGMRRIVGDRVDAGLQHDLAGLVFLRHGYAPH